MSMNFQNIARIFNLVVLLAVFIACPAFSAPGSSNPSGNAAVSTDNGDSIAQDEPNKIYLVKIYPKPGSASDTPVIEVDLNQFLQTFYGEGETTFSCEKLCEGFDERNLTKCLEMCDKAKLKSAEYREHPLCDQPPTMELVSAGSFLMGATDNSFYAFVYLPARVIITNAFYIDKYEVTQDEFNEVMGFNPAYYKGKKCGGKCPVESVTWDEASEYCAKIGKRLPTSAEWEFAAKGKTLTQHYWGDEIDTDYLWYNDDSGKKPHPVGLKRPNSYGLFDMEGNVFEYVQDCVSYYSNDRNSKDFNFREACKSQEHLPDFYFSNFVIDLFVDPLYAQDNCNIRLIKGGSFDFDGQKAAPYFYLYQDVNERRGDRGFRCVMNAYDDICAKDNN